MKQPDRRSILITSTVSALAGLLFLAFTQLTSWSPTLANRFDAAIILAIFSSDSNVSHSEDNARKVIVRPLCPQPELSRVFQPIRITDDPDRIFESCPPSPLDYAIIFDRLLQQGHRQIVVGTRINWDTRLDEEQNAPTSLDFDDRRLPFQALEAKLALFDRALIGLALTRGVEPHPLPEALKHSLIPLGEISGDSSLIPVVNQLPVPQSIHGGPTTQAGFHRLENAPSPNKRNQLLARWSGTGDENGFIPSLQLLIIMLAHDAEIEDLEIVVGEHIRIGQNGPLIPIDAFGQTTAFGARPSTPAPLAALDLISRQTLPPSDQNPTNKAPVAFVYADDKTTISSSILPAQAMLQSISLAQTLPCPASPVVYQRLAFWKEALLLVALGLTLSLPLAFSTYYRNLSYALALPAIFVILLIWVDWQLQWFGIIAPTLTIISAWICARKLASDTRTD